MAGRHQIRALGRKGGDDDAAGTIGADAEDALLLTADAEELDLAESWLEEGDAAVPPARSGWLPVTLAMLALGGWTGFFGWAHQGVLFGGAAPSEWTALIGQWSLPAGLIGIVWLLAMRSSRAEAHRFAASAALLSRESAELETRLKVVNRELSLAREFLSAEARDLETLGRMAADRIAAHAAQLQGLIITNGAQVEAIGTASETALGNMNRLRDDLPVIANAARDVSNQIGSVGRMAEDQLERLTGGFVQLEVSGAQSEAKVQQVGAEVGQTLAGLESTLARIETVVSERFAALRADAETYRARIETLEAEALTAHSDRARALAAEGDAINERLRAAGDTARTAFEQAIAALHENLVEKLRMVDDIDRSTGAAAGQRIAALRDEAVRFDEHIAERNRRFDELMAQRQALLSTHEAQSAEGLAQRLADLDEAIAARSEAQLAGTEKLLAHSEALAERLDALQALINTVGECGETARTSLGAGLGTLGQALAEKRAALAETEGRLSDLTDSGVRLLEIIQAGARSTREDLATAITGASESLEGVAERAGEVQHLMLTSAQSGADLSDYLQRTSNAIDDADTAIAGFKSRLVAETEEALARLQGLRGGFARLAEESGTLAGETQEALRSALGLLETAIAQAFATLDTGARERTAALAERIGGEAVDVLERTLRNEAAATIGKLEQAAAHASGVGREAAMQLRDQLVKVNELTGNLEQRVTRARELAEEQVNNDFARRMALITDSLNSAAIDISSALSSEIADTAWDAYLKGDRGIFTRRAVRLIDNGAARDIAALYSNDETFKANVSRYIHDFEAMLRAILSTRDGHVLSVTMLGSDMGKLYVALAQAIERFRT